MQPESPAAAEQPSEDPFRFGYRLTRHTLADGSVEYERVALTLEDVLHPEPDDVIPVRPIHAIDCRYLVGVFRARAAATLANRPIVYVSDDHLVDWGVPGQRATSPDVGLFVGLKQEVGPEEGTFDYKESGGRCLVVVEVVSPDRRENDVIHKLGQYYRAGVSLYVLVDQEKEGGPRFVRGFRWRSTGYEQLASDELGLLIEPLNLFLGLKEGRVACFDEKTGREIGDYESVSRDLEEADRRIQEQELAIEQAVLKSHEQARAIEAAEKLAQEQTLARENAERLAREKTLALEAAERQAREQTLARENAERLVQEQIQAREERIRQLEAALQVLQQPPA